MLRVMNRLLLGLLGIGLLLLGLSALVAAADLPSRWGFGMPSGWSWNNPDEVLLTDGDRTQWRDEGWWWPVVLVVLGLLVLLALWWVLAQLRRQRTGEFTVARTGGSDASDGEEGPDAVLRARALEEVMAAEARSLPGVARARATLAGSRSSPKVRMGLLLDEAAVPDETVHRLHTEVLEHARSSAGFGELSTQVRLRSVRHGASRVS